MKKTLKYQLHDFRTSLFVYLSIYIAVVIIIGVTVISTGAKPGGANVNGYNSMYCMLIINFILAIATIIFTLIFIQMSGLHWSTIFGLLYSRFDQNIIITFIVSMLFIFSAYNLCFLSGYFVTILFYKASKIGKVVIAAGLPVLFFFILPLSYGFIPEFWNTVLDFIFRITGMASGNPFYGIITISVIAAILGIISYPLAKRVEI